jgi:hypothetical protein
MIPTGTTNTIELSTLKHIKNNILADILKEGKLFREKLLFFASYLVERYFN